MSKYCIVVVGYNRLKCLKRLLNSLLAAEYYGDSVDLKISLDNCGSDQLVNYARKFKWPHGDIEVRHQKKRLGLKCHILACGDYLNAYDAIAVFEDDLVASPYFYNYMRQAVPFYENDQNVAGISLYGYQWNVFAKAPFMPEWNGRDTYFIQLAQSWGQIWMKRSWFEFREWLDNVADDIGKCDGLPNAVKHWSDKSWLKFHMQYCVECDKYFVYPYASLSTCFEEAGEHCVIKETALQVPLMNVCDYIYKFEKFSNSLESVVYDAYFERKNISIIVDGVYTPLEMDMYGEKDPSCVNNRYLASTNNYDYRIMKSFALEMRPAEENVLRSIDGDEIKLFDLESISINKKKSQSIVRMIYYHRLYGNSRLLSKVIFEKIKSQIKLRIKKL